MATHTHKMGHMRPLTTKIKQTLRHPHLLEPFTSCKLQWKLWLHSYFPLRSTCGTIWWDSPRNWFSTFQWRSLKTHFHPTINFANHCKVLACVLRIQTLVKEVRWLFSGHFWSIFLDRSKNWLDRIKLSFCKLFWLNVTVLCTPILFCFKCF
jgi:hypothetical protein